MWRLSIFPWLLHFDFFAPTILRLGLAIVLLWFQTSKNNASNKHLKRLQIICAGLIFIGLWTQLAALITVIITGWQVFKTKADKQTTAIRILIIIVSLSLLLSGAGGLALDWPI